MKTVLKHTEENYSSSIQSVRFDVKVKWIFILHLSSYLKQVYFV